MKKTLSIVLAVALIFTVAAMAFASVADPKATEGKAARTLENVHKGNQAINMELIWDEDSGTFKMDNIYTTGVYDENGDATTGDVLSQGAAGDGDLVGTAKNYTYWDGKKWVTLDDITRYEGQDSRAEAVVSRYDKTWYTYSTSYWEAVTGTQTLYTTWVSKRVIRRDPYYYTYYYTYSRSTGERAKTGTFSKITEVPAAYDPVVEVTLQNGWKVEIRSDYTQWGNEVKITSPSGQTSHVYGDPHLLQANGTQQQELAAVGNYVFKLGDFTLDLECAKSNRGFSLVTDLSISGPNDYQMTYGRNNEVKVEGGTK